MVNNEEMVKAANLLLKLADENKALKSKVAELTTENSSLKRERKAEKIAHLMAERGLIEPDSVHEKIASLIKQDDLEAYEAAVDLTPKVIEIGTVEKVKTASVKVDDKDMSPMELVCFRHLGLA